MQKGQPIFEITPDEKFVAVDPKEIERERRSRTSAHLDAVLMSPHEKLYEVKPTRLDLLCARPYLRAV